MFNMDPQGDQVAKEYLDGELAKYDSWDKYVTGSTLKGIFKNKKAFLHSKKKGVATEPIKRFLGGSWKGHVIEDALRTIKGVESGEISNEAVSVMPSTPHEYLKRRPK
jgi:hypothetical protein